MLQVSFYHLTKRSLELALPSLLIKALEASNRIAIHCPDDELVKRLSQSLWQAGTTSFLAHGTPLDGFTAAEQSEQPIWITSGEEYPNSANLLILTAGRSFTATTLPPSVTRILDFFDGNDEAAVQAARERYRASLDAGHELIYFTQEINGNWKKSASLKKTE